MDVQNRIWRLQSFDKWTLGHFFNLQMLALVGFYLNREDPNYLRCVYCSAKCKIKPEENPCLEHIRMSPRCIHMLSIYGTEYIKRFLREENEDYTLDHAMIPCRGVFQQRDEIFYIPEVFGNKGPVYKVNQSGFQKTTSEYVTLNGISLKEPKYEIKGPPSERLSSYIHASFMQSSVDDLVACGFFWDPCVDKHVCYYCGVSVDPNDNDFFEDVWKQHALRGEWCGHIILTKGEMFIQTIHSGRVSTSSEYGNAQGHVVNEMLQRMVTSMKNIKTLIPGKRQFDEETELDSTTSPRKKLRVFPILEKCGTDL